MHDDSDTDVIVIGAGLAGLVAAAELVSAGRRVTLLDQDGEQALGGQAFWSFGAVCLVDTPEQQALGVHDSVELAWRDWERTAGFDREREDRWPRRWARAYLDFAAGEMRDWLVDQGVRFLPIVPWVERRADEEGPGNSVPRFHIAQGTGHGIVEPFARAVRDAAARGQLALRPRHRVEELTVTDGAVDGVRGSVLEPTDAPRGAATSREPVGRFELRAKAVVVASGGIGGNYELVAKNWPERLGTAPAAMLAGVSASADGAMLETAERAGGHVVNRDRMWHYSDGVSHHTPVWPNHGIRIIPGPSSLWLDATGRRLRLGAGVDALSKVTQVHATGYTHSWLLLTREIAETELTLSGSEENPDLTEGPEADRPDASAGRFAAVPGPVRAFLERGEDFVVRDDLRALVDAMNALTPEPLLDPDAVEQQVRARDDEADHAAEATNDDPAPASRPGDRLVRTARPHRLTDPAAGPMIAVRLHLLTRKTMGGLETDLEARVLRADGTPVAGLYAAGEAAGFGGGGMHGYRALEGTFLGGCLFTGRQAGRAAAASAG